MRRILFFLVMGSIALVANRSYAQKYIGVVGGANMANESLKSQSAGITSSSRLGIVAGLEVERWFSPEWAVDMRGMYLQQGHNDNLNQTLTGILSGSTRTGADNVETNTLDFDLLLKRTLIGNDVIRAYAFAGPSLGGIVSGKEYLNDTVKTNSVWFVGDTTYSIAYTNGLDWSVVFGLGISMKLDSGPMIFLDAGYWYGLTNLYEWDGGGVYTRDIRLTAGVQFPIHMPSLLLK